METGLFNLLCAFCRDHFNEHSPWAGGVFDTKRVRNTKSLASSAAQGCHFCRLIDHMRSEFLDDEDVTFELRHSPHATRLLEFRFRPIAEDGIPRKERFRCIDLIRLKNGFDPTIKQLAHRSTWSPETRLQAHEWIMECQGHHNICNSKTSPMASHNTRLPARLLAVGTISDSLVRLVSSSALPNNSRYMTLSHCWGQSSSPILLKGNLRGFMDEIPVSELPKTHSEAIRVTRELDIQYLWIDSLCIIQDSDEDWRQESAMMEMIYSNSHCTIAAAASGDGNGGLFFERDALAATPCQVSCTWDVHQPESLLCYDNDPWVDVELGPLNSRAWVLQERLLSPCVLLFAKDQVYWECSELMASESCPSGLPTYFSTPKFTWSSIAQARCPTSSPSGLAVQSESSLFKPGATPNENRQQMNVWNSVVLAYSYGQLTFGSDKLVAVSGLARQFSKAVGFAADDYLAGLWRSELEGQLLWFTITISAHGQVRDPSWSWSSVDGWIQPAFSTGNDVIDSWSNSIQVLEASTSPIADPFGAVSRGYIIVLGPICRVERPDEGAKRFDWWQYPAAFFCDEEWRVNSNQFDCSWSVETLDLDNVEVDSLYLMPSIVMRFQGENSFEKTISSTGLQEIDNARSRDGSPEEHVYGLVLARMLAAKGQYQRIGAFKTMHKGLQATLCEAVKARTLCEGDYLGFDGGEHYTIRIV